jgi:hypothetical protein
MPPLAQTRSMTRTGCPFHHSPGSRHHERISLTLYDRLRQMNADGAKLLTACTVIGSLNNMDTTNHLLESSGIILVHLY